MNPVIIVAVAVVVILLLYVICTRNSFVKANNSVEEAFSTMDVYLKKRWDLIPNLVNTVKGYAAHETSTLEKLVSMRTSTYSSLSTEDKINANNELSNGISKLLAIAENYPDLKANQNFLNLSNELADTEDEIANSRKYYNAVVKNFNNKVQMFPSNVIAGMFGYKKKTMFEAAQFERQNVKVEF